MEHCYIIYVRVIFYRGLLWFLPLLASSRSPRGSTGTWSAAQARAVQCGPGVRPRPVSSPRPRACSSLLASKGRLGLSPLVPLLSVGARWFALARVAPAGPRVPSPRSVRPGRSRCGSLLACPPAPPARGSALAGSASPGSRHVPPPLPPCPPPQPLPVLVAGGKRRAPAWSPLGVGLALVRAALALVSGSAPAPGVGASRVVAGVAQGAQSPGALAPLVAVGPPACPLVPVPLSARIGPGGPAAPRGPARALAVVPVWSLAHGARVGPCRGCLVVAPVVMLCGSRSLPGAAVPQLGAVVSALLGSGSLLAAGCAAGADAAAVSSAVSAGAAPRLAVYAVGGSSGVGFAGSVSAFPVVHSAAAAGAAVRWWSGGAASVPLRARLVARSLACVRAAAAGGPGSGLVAFVAQLPPRSFAPGLWPSCGSGSWGSAGAAAQLGLPVVLVPVGPLAGVSLHSLPALPGGGSWSPVSAGVLSGGFRWVRSA